MRFVHAAAAARFFCAGASNAAAGGPALSQPAGYGRVFAALRRKPMRRKQVKPDRRFCPPPSSAHIRNDGTVKTSVRISKQFKYAVGGAASGLVNGFFGGGGGMFLVPVLIRWAKMDERRAFATSVLVILPLCAVSSVIYLLRTELSLTAALPYLAGGLFGGLLGGKLFSKVSMIWLRRVFALLLLYGGVRALL